MRVQVVGHEHPARITVGLDRMENVPQEVFFGPCRADRRSNHLSLDDVPIPSQTQRAVARVFEFNPRRLAWLHRDCLGIAFQGLNARHLVHTHCVRVVLEIQFRRLQVSVANYLHLLLEYFGVLLRGVEPVLAAMGLEISLGQIPIHLTGGDRIDNAAVNRLVGQFPAGPRLDRPARLTGRFTSEGDDLRDLFGRMSAGTTASRRVAENVFDGAAEHGPWLTTFDGYQGVKGLLPASSPAAHLLSRQLHFGSDGHIECASERK